MSKGIVMTYSIAMAAARDAGNRSMREGYRTKWAVKDWNVACETFERLWPSPKESTSTSNPTPRAGRRVEKSDD